MTNKKQKTIPLTKEQILTLSKKEIIDLAHKANLIDNPSEYYPTQGMHPTAEERKNIKHVSKETFTRYAKKCGTGGHIGVSRHWVDKLVRVTIEEVPEE